MGKDGTVTLIGPLPRDPRPHRLLRSSVRAGGVWALVATAFSLLVWLIASAFGVSFLVWPDGTGGEPVGVGALAIVGTTLLSGLLAGLVTGLLAKVVRQVVRWVVVGGVVLTAASITGPLEQPSEVGTSTRVCLIIMHLVTGALVTFGLARGIWTDDRAVTA